MRSQTIRPSRAEFYGGMTVLAVLAAVSMTRFGRPQVGWADHVVSAPPIQPPPARLQSENRDQPAVPSPVEPNGQAPTTVDPTLAEALRQISVDPD